MTPDFNRNGKRPPSSLDQLNHHHLPIHLQNNSIIHPTTLNHRLPLDPLPTNSNPPKRLRTLPNTLDLSNPTQRPAIKKSLSGLIFPRPSHSLNANTIDLLKPSNAPSPNKKPTSLQAHRPLATLLTPNSPLPALDKDNRTARDKQRNKESLKREIIQWQEKYRIAIKSFVFYLDRLDAPTEHELGAKIQDLGARVDQFFSRDVTHVITDQPVPATFPAPSPTAHAAKRGATSAYQLPAAHPSPSRNKENGLPAGSRRPLKHRLEQDVQPTPDPAPAVDPLIRKALQLKMKIWKSEKLLNVLCRLEDNRSPVKQTLKPSLPSLLLKEAQQGHTNEHDPVASRSDYYYFGPKALFIMIEDAIQEYKPIVIKEFSRPKTRDVSGWPIMWGGTEGKSAFSRHSAKQSYIQVRNRIRNMYEQRARAFTQSPAPSCTRLRSPERADDAPLTVLPAQQNLRRAVSMNMLQRRQSVRLSRLAARPLVELDEEDTSGIDHAHPGGAEHQRGPGHVFLPASGNSVSATSAMPSAPSTRSSALRTGPMGQMLVDKRLAALGKRPTFQMGGQPGGSSLKRELAGLGVGGQKGRLESLKRETEEIRVGGLKRSQSLDGAMMEQKKQDQQAFGIRRSSLVGGGVGGGSGGRKGLGVRAKLGNGYDLIDLKRLVFSSQTAAGGRNSRNHHQHEEVAKAGYCENCRTKYPDFKRHIQARRHRRFALEQTNWIELDMMLKRTTRRLKPNVRVPPSVREMLGVACDDEEEEDEEEDEDEDDEEEEEDVEEEDVEDEQEEEVEEEEVEEVEEVAHEEEEGDGHELEEEEVGHELEEEDEEEEVEEVDEEDEQVHEESAYEVEEENECLDARNDQLGFQGEKKGGDQKALGSGNERGGDDEDEGDQEEEEVYKDRYGENSMAESRDGPRAEDGMCGEEDEETGGAQLEVLHQQDVGRGSSEGGEPEKLDDEASTQVAQDRQENLDENGSVTEQVVVRPRTDGGERGMEAGRTGGGESEREAGGVGGAEIVSGSAQMEVTGGKLGGSEPGRVSMEAGGERGADSVNVQLEEEFRQIWRVQQEAAGHAQGEDRCGSRMSTKTGLVGSAYGDSEGGGGYSMMGGRSESVVVELEEGEEVEDHGGYYCWEAHQQQGHSQQQQQQRMRFEWASGGGMECQETSEGMGMGLGLGLEGYSSDEGVEEGEVVEDSEMRREKRRRERTGTGGTVGTNTGTMSSGWGGSVGGDHHPHSNQHIQQRQHYHQHQREQGQMQRGVWVFNG